MQERAYEYMHGKWVLDAFETILKKTKRCFYCKQEGHWVEDCGNLETLKKYCSKDKSAKLYCDSYVAHIKTCALIGDIATEGMAWIKADKEVMASID